MPLGSQRATDEFLALSQFQGIDQAFLPETFVTYDPTYHRVHVSYVPSGCYGLEQSLVFDGLTGLWRGPWKRRFYSSGFLRNDAGDDVWVMGGDLGNILVDEEQDEDVIDTTDSPTQSGTITTVHAERIISDSSADFNPSSDSDNKLVGCPIHFFNSAGTLVDSNYVAFIHSSTKIETLHFPAEALTTSHTYKIGAINWKVETAAIDAGEPIQQKTAHKLRLRFGRGTTDTFTAKISVDGAAFEAVEASGPTTVDVVHSEVRLKHRGHSHEFQLEGVATAGHPKITVAVADLDIKGGASS